MSTKKIGCGAMITTVSCTDLNHPYMDQFRLDDEVRILLVRRGFAAPTYPGEWVCPAGLMDPTDVTSAVTAAREALEEVGIAFCPNVRPFYTGERDGRELHYFLGSWRFPNPDKGVVLRPTHSSGKAIFEVISYDWCTYEEAIAKPLGFRWREAIEKLHAEPATNF